MKKMGAITDCVVNDGAFPEPQWEFLNFQRSNVLLKRS